MGKRLGGDMEAKRCAVGGGQKRLGRSVTRKGGGGGGTKPCNLAALLAVGGVNRLLANHEDLVQAFLRRGLPGSRRSTKSLCWPTVSVSPSVAGRGTNTFEGSTRPVCGVQALCHGGAPRSSPRALLSCLLVFMFTIAIPPATSVTSRLGAPPPRLQAHVWAPGGAWPRLVCAPMAPERQWRLAVSGPKAMPS